MSMDFLISSMPVHCPFQVFIEQSSQSSNLNNRKRSLPREEETTTTIDDEPIPLETSRRGGSSSSMRGRGNIASDHNVTTGRGGSEVIVTEKGNGGKRGRR
ncbi:unnamed protein product [Didymodactylos carnosus]|uniref:Uncharacterized protein n=1 Tax=Didymodactylos carnosus TaxID=1234261 RepID=A0A814VY59_9BILA|nr:unnamed protein product [Didymodactylos carnosus]CAF1194326.1 unnamed protein product [Didymodactylos carnosus]CAF3958687.1 unnamed protein product [Didymodactylos carnosus]CAF3984855.1 unnamed protein product [Didymodactylos carnosus]